MMMHARNRARVPGRRAFTLIEVVLAVAVLAGLSLLVASMWSQTRRWSEDVRSSDRLLRLQRVGEMLRSQWSDRRVAAALDEDGNTVAASPRELNFVTATPVLFPQTPLVSATYRIEPDDLARPGDGPRYALIYVERTISDLAPVKGEDSEEPRALDAPAAMSERLVLLRGVKDLRWERFGEADRRAGDALPEDEDDVPGAGNRDDPARERRRAERRRREEAAREPTPEEEAARTPEERRQKWRAFARPDVLRVPAVRLVGEHEGEAFSWVFVIEALR